MHFDHLMDTMGGRHLVYAYAAVFLIQGGYLAWIALEWQKTRAFAAQKLSAPNRPT